MQYLHPFITEILILLFILITFLQSGLDKATDWSGNISWLKKHFSGTFMAGMVPFMVAIVMIAEILAGILAFLGIIWILLYANTSFGFFAAVIAAITLLMLLFGQRLAKDYAGAFTITGYFVVVLAGVYILS